MICIRLADHKDQRYNTVGDWRYLDLNDLIITVSNTGNDAYNFLIALHELIEAQMCKDGNISHHEVDIWDKEHLRSKDPGSIPGCPYYREHMIASAIEFTMACFLNINWGEYEDCLDGLTKSWRE